MFGPRGAHDGQLDIWDYDAGRWNGGNPINDVGPQFVNGIVEKGIPI